MLKYVEEVKPQVMEHFAEQAPQQVLFLPVHFLFAMLYWLSTPISENIGEFYYFPSSKNVLTSWLASGCGCYADDNYKYSGSTATAAL